MNHDIRRHLILGEVILILLVCSIWAYRKHRIQSNMVMVPDAENYNEQITLDYEHTRDQDAIYDNSEYTQESSSGQMSGTEATVEDTQEKITDYIKWIDFNVTCKAMDDAYEYDLESRTGKVKIHWIELLSYLGAKYGGEFKQYKEKDLKAVVDQIVNQGKTMEEITKDMKYYNYYHEAYEAVLGGFVGDYKIETVSDTQPEVKTWEERYGLKAFLPIAKNFPYNDYDDFGVSRTYGFRRQHLGHDMMGQVGTPIIAVESGYIEALGWNQYGGWRIGVRSLDGKRYYYYAHLRKNFPYVKSLKEGDIVQAGDVIGYLGRTGYSRTENTNNIDTPHLHFGMQIIFDESQKECNNEIWINCYEIVKFLYKNRSEAIKNEETKEWIRTQNMMDPSIEEYKRLHGMAVEE